MIIASIQSWALKIKFSTFWLKSKILPEVAVTVNLARIIQIRKSKKVAVSLSRLSMCFLRQKFLHLAFLTTLKMKKSYKSTLKMKSKMV